MSWTTEIKDVGKWKDGEIGDTEQSEHPETLGELVVEIKTLSQKRGFKGSVKVEGQSKQVCCGCVDSYTKQTRKAKTSPVSMKIFNAGASFCKVCNFMPWVVLPREQAFRVLIAYTKTRCECTDRHRETGNLCVMCRTKIATKPELKTRQATRSELRARKGGKS
jgi:hypothetical protein